MGGTAAQTAGERADKLSAIRTRQQAECERAAKDHAADRYLWDVSIKAAWADCKEAREEYERMRREVGDACSTGLRLDLPAREIVARVRAALSSPARGEPTE